MNENLRAMAFRGQRTFTVAPIDSGDPLDEARAANPMADEASAAIGGGASCAGPSL